MSFMESLFGCFSDCSSCVIVAFVPCGMACIQGSVVSLANQAAANQGLPDQTSFMNSCLCNSVGHRGLFQQ